MTLEEKIKYFESKMNDCKATMDNLGATLAELKDEVKLKEQETRFEPDYGDDFAFINCYGNVGSGNVGSYSLDSENAKIADFNNVFRPSSITNLKKYSHDVLRVQNRLMQLHEELCPEYFPNWDGYNGHKFYLFLDEANEKWDWIGCHCYNSGVVYFSNTETAQKACEILNAERFMMDEE